MNTQYDENSLLANIIESSDIIIYSRDRNGYITTWNSSAELLFGYQKQEIIGKHYSKLIPRASQKAISLAMNEALTGTIIRSFETVHKTKSQKVIPIGMKISPIQNTDGTVIGVSVTARDLRREVNFREKEKFMARVSHLLGSSLKYEKTLLALARLLVPRFSDWCAIHTKNQDTSEIQLAITHSNNKKNVWINRKTNKRSKVKYTELGITVVLESGKPLFYSPHLLDNPFKPLKRYEKLIKKMKFTSIIVVPLSSRKKVLGSITLGTTSEDKQFTQEDFALIQELGLRAGQAIDNALLYSELENKLVERKQFISELRRSRNQLEIILQNISDGISVQDKNEKLIFVNETLAKEWGYQSPQEMIEKPDEWVNTYDLFSQSGEKYNLEKLPYKRAFNGEDSPQDIVHFLHKETGESRWTIMKAQAVKDENQQTQLVISITHDITEIQKEEIKKDEFISMASHELNTPLTSLSIYLHLLKKNEMKDHEKVRHLTEKIEIQTNKLIKLVTDLLDISKIQSGKLDYHMENFSINSLIEEICETHQATTNKHKIHVHGEPILVYGDRNRINQVHTNLLTNAIKYSPNGGSIFVRVTKNETHAEISVTDTGIGISSVHHKKIFTKLYQVNTPQEKTYPGLGIGLYISQDIIKRHGGQIGVKSKRGAGSTFTYTIPLSK